MYAINGHSKLPSIMDSRAAKNPVFTCNRYIGKPRVHLNLLNVHGIERSITESSESGRILTRKYCDCSYIHFIEQHFLSSYFAGVREGHFQYRVHWLFSVYTKSIVVALYFQGDWWAANNRHSSLCQFCVQPANRIGLAR